MRKTWTYDLQKQYYKWEFGLGWRLTILHLLDKDIWIIHFAKTYFRRPDIFQYLSYFCLRLFCSFAAFVSLRFCFQRITVAMFWWHDTFLAQTAHEPDQYVTG